MLTSIIAGSLIAPLQSLAQNGAYLDAYEMGLKPDVFIDQSALLQKLVDDAARAGLVLFVRGGKYIVANIELPSDFMMRGVSGVTSFTPSKDESVFVSRYQQNITLENIVIDGATAFNQHLIFIRECKNITIENVTLKNSGKGGIFLEKCQGKISNCDISNIKQAAIHIQDSNGMMVSANNINDCKNAGILVWRYEPGYDGSIITNNKISNIASQSGSGQNGNAINSYQANEVIIANNSITNCAFSAIRVNSTINTIIDGNLCTNCQEVAIFSEFAFSGSIISNNIVDQAALGISMTNFDHEGYLAVCSGNIVRNIWEFSPTNPDTRPIAIYAEADCAVYGNLIEKVPGIGIVAGWGPYLRNVHVSQNIISDTKIAIAASVVKGAGTAKISDNIISNASIAAINGMAWLEIIGSDVSKDEKQFSNLIVKDNIVT